MFNSKVEKIMLSAHDSKYSTVCIGLVYYRPLSLSLSLSPKNNNFLSTTYTSNLAFSFLNSKDDVILRSENGHVEESWPQDKGSQDETILFSYARYQNLGAVILSD